MRDIGRRLPKLEERGEQIALLWKADQPVEDVMGEHFGTTEAPPGLKFYLLCWDEGAPDEMPQPMTQAAGAEQFQGWSKRLH